MSPSATSPNDDSLVVGAIEAGGTKFLCAVGSGPDDIRAETRIPTGAPHDTIERVVDFLRASADPIAAIGIATFGPLDVDPRSDRYGIVAASTKVGWQGTDIRSRLAQAFAVPVAIETDVLAAAIGEWRWGSHGDPTILTYITIGTGIGGGTLLDGRPLRGHIHQELGHMAVPHDTTIDPFPGVCPFHRDCLEGLASGPAIEARWGSPAASLPPEHPAWELEAGYLAMGLRTVVYTLAPDLIVVGGGVANEPTLLRRVRAELAQSLHGYQVPPSVGASLDDYIVSPALGDRAGLLGAIAIAQAALRDRAP